MSSITALVGTDGVTTANSMTKINTNFANLNSGKLESSALDTDSTLGGASASDSKIPSQLATKLYVDSGGNPLASETTQGIVQEATDAQVTAGTATGSTGAKLFVTPAKLATYAPAQNTQIFTGNGTWTKPANAKNVVVTLIAGGGGGGGYGNNPYSASGAGGGGAGALATYVL